MLLYFYFDKIVKGSGTSFQFWALRQIHDKNVCHMVDWYLTKFHFDSSQDSK